MKLFFLMAKLIFITCISLLCSSLPICVVFLLIHFMFFFRYFQMDGWEFGWVLSSQVCFQVCLLSWIAIPLSPAWLYIDKTGTEVQTSKVLTCISSNPITALFVIQTNFFVTSKTTENNYSIWLFFSNFLELLRWGNVSMFGNFAKYVVS